MQLVLFLGDLERLFRGCGVGDFERCDFLAVYIYHKYRAPKLNVGIEIGGEITDETRDGDFTRSFGIRKIHISSILGGGCEAHEDGMDGVVAVGEDDFGAIEGNVFDDVFFGGIGHGAFYLEFRHCPEKKLVHRVGVGRKTVRIISHDPFAIDLFEGEVGHFGIVGADGDFVDGLGRFE